MARHVFCNGDVAWSWMQQRVSHGRSHNGNFSFDGAKLYSYSTCIGNIEKAIDGLPVYLLTSHHYSQTTSAKHVPPARRCVGHHHYFFCVPNVVLHGGAHDENLRYLIDQYQKVLKRCRGKLEQLTDDNCEWPWRYLESRANSVANYCEAFGMAAPAIDPSADMASIIAHHAKREEWRQSPRGIKSREYGRKYRAWLGLLRDMRLRYSRFGIAWHHDDDTYVNCDSYIGAINMWISHFGSQESLDIIRWRFRNAE